MTPTTITIIIIIYTIILLKSVRPSVRPSVCRCSQTAGRNSCSIVSGDVSNCLYRLTVYPLTSSRFSSGLAFFYMRKTLKTSGKPGRQCECLFQLPATSYCHQRSGPSRLTGTDPSNSDTATAVCVCVGGGCAHVRAGECVRPFVRACVHACVRVCACVRDVFEIYDNNI